MTKAKESANSAEGDEAGNGGTQFDTLPIQVVVSSVRASQREEHATHGRSVEGG